MGKKFYRYKSLWLLVIFVIYLLLGFFFVPRIIEQQLQDQLTTRLNMQAEVNQVSFNPLTFTTDLEQLSIKDKNNQQWLDVNRASINFDPLNLLWGQWQFSEMQLIKPIMTFTTDEAGQILVPALPEFKPSSDEPLALNVSIEDINIQQGKMRLQADNVKKDFALSIKTLRLKLDQFSFDDEAHAFELTVGTDNDEFIELNGHYNHTQQLIDSQLTLKDWQATTLNQVLSDQLAVKNKRGLIQAQGSIKWNLAQKPVLNLTTVDLQAVDSSWQQAVYLTDLAAQIHDIKVDINAQTIEAAAIESNHAKWQVNWPLEVMTDNQQSESTEPASWQVQVAAINVSDWPLTLIDTDLNQTLPLKLESLHIQGINNLNQPFQMNARLNMAQQGDVLISSENTLQPTVINSQVTVNALNLTHLSPWIASQSGLVITQGQLNAEQNLLYQDNQFEIKGSLHLTDAIMQNSEQQEIITLGNLRIGATHISSEQKTIILDQITLDQANGQILQSSQNINVQNLNEMSEPSETNEWVILVGEVKRQEGKQ